ncbi:anoctamin-4-like isoform X1 [Paramuricea clavata]|uniref:Anoctamin n=1 Tax=Paramuricea clavata TaxID=317549 RepID=A0A6S7GVZ2_PARCT|nr:anoctamin-4-like isoform X1 [Paramuricea clavata]
MEKQEGETIGLKNEGAILLENQVNTPDDEGQNMASPSVNMEPTKNKMRDGSSIVDMVMVYEVPDPSTLDTEKEQQQEADKNTIRDFYINALKAADLLVETDQLAIAKAEDNNENKQATVFFVKIHAPWNVCTKKAEEMFLRMPLQESDIEIRSTLETIFGQRFVESVRAKSPMEIDRNIIPDDKMYFTAYFTEEHEAQFLGVENHETFFSPTDRIRMVERIMEQTAFSENSEHDIGVAKLLYTGAFSGVYPLHDGPCEVPEGGEPANLRQRLRAEWAKFRKWYKFQPLDAIKDYLGTSIGLYFAWLGFYCTMLAPVAFLGFIVFIFGIGSSFSYKPAEDACDSPETAFIMCPLCDKQCWYWYLKISCTYLKVAHWFDNDLSVAFACIMSIWSTLFLEFWKRQQAILGYTWHTLDFEEVEEQVRPEYAAVVTTLRENPATGRMEPYTPKTTLYKKYAGVFSVVAFMITLVLFAVIGVVVYRAAVFGAAASSSDGSIRTNAKIITSMTAAVLNLIAINILKFVYQYVAHWLTNWQNPRTKTDWEDSYTVKMYIYQFVNMYSSLFYIAFFKINLFVGTPGHYLRMGKNRLDGCGAQGCLVELCIQLVIIMVGQQVISNFTEVMIPYLTKLWNERKATKESITHLPQWEQDYFLPAVEGTMFWEYLEVVLQLGFVMMFVAAFPLAPLFAFANGVLEIRVDAINFIRDQRRPMPNMAEDIGAWYPIIDALSSFSVLVNAFVIAFTSDFISKVVYRYSYSPNDSLTGYLDNSLSYFNTSDWSSSAKPQKEYDHVNITEPHLCRYVGYRSSAAGEPFTKQHWEVMAARFAFIFLFQFSMTLIKRFLAWAIPDMPSDLDLKRKREEHIAQQKLHQRPGKVGRQTSQAKTYI